MRKNIDQSHDKRQDKNAVGIQKSVENTPWDLAIAEARRRIADLRFSIKDFEKRKTRGDQWLGWPESETSTNKLATRN